MTSSPRPPSRLPLLAAAAVALAAGLMVGRVSRPAPGACAGGTDLVDRLEDLIRRHQHAPRAPPPPALTGASAAELGAVVRAELERHASEPPPTAPPPPPVVTTAELLAGLHLIDAAVAERSWTDARRDQLLVVLPRLDPAQSREVVARLMAAINEGRLRVDTEETPF